jgi:hypothetical protein
MSNEATISQYFQGLGIPAAPFSPMPGLNGVNGTIATHMGLQIDVQIHHGQLLLAQLVIGYVPQTNVAPLFRQLLVSNSMMIGVYFCLLDNNAILLRTSRNVEGLDQIELKMLLDNLCSNTFQHGLNVKNTFQLPALPGQ